MKRRTYMYSDILVYLYITWMCVEFTDRTLGVTMCKDGSFDRGTSLSLDISLGNLSTYAGNCTCTVQVINTLNNVTLTSNITLTLCGSMSLVSSHWDYTATCPNDVPFNKTRLLEFTQATIFLDVSRPTGQNQVSGSLVLTSHLGDLTLKCDGAVYDIPEPRTSTTTITTTPPTTTRTTTEEPTVIITVNVGAIAGGLVAAVVVVAIVVIGVLLFRRYRKSQGADHTDMPVSESHPTYCGLTGGDNRVYDHIDTPHQDKDYYNVPENSDYQNP